MMRHTTPFVLGLALMLVAQAPGGAAAQQASDRLSLRLKTSVRGSVNGPLLNGVAKE
jgi:hypothetical protein